MAYIYLIGELSTVREISVEVVSSDTEKVDPKSECELAMLSKRFVR